MTIWHYLAVAFALVGAAITISSLPAVAALNVVTAGLIIVGAPRKDRK